MTLRRALLMSATAISVCLLSGQTLAAHSSEQRVNRLEKKIAHLQEEMDAIEAKQSKSKKKGKAVQHDNSKVSAKNLSILARMVRGGVTISTTPYLGLRNGVVLYNVPSMNEDLRILKQRVRLEEKLNALGSSLNDRTLIGISGALEGNFMEQNNWRSKWSGNTDLATAEIDIGVMAGSWVNAFFSIAYNGKSTDTGSRTPNNVLYLKRGFLTIGDLKKSPFYFSIGQMYVPFGRYATAMITTPLTQSVGRISARAAVIGYSSGPLFAQVYGYNSQSQNKSSFPTDEGGVNFGGQYDFGTHSFSFGIGAVSNLADSQGSLDNGNPASTTAFNGFSGSGANFTLRRNVPAVDVYANYNWGAWSLVAEVLGAVRRYDPLDMFYQSTTRGAKPGALHTEIDYNTHFFGKPATAAITYGQTWQAVAMNLPHHSIAVLYDVQVWRHATIGVEVRHDINYKGGTAGGGAIASATQGSIAPVCEGSTRDIITARFGVYF